MMNEVSFKQKDQILANHHSKIVILHEKHFEKRYEEQRDPKHHNTMTETIISQHKFLIVYLNCNSKRSRTPKYTKTLIANPIHGSGNNYSK